MFKIVHTEDNCLRFADGTTITCNHEQDCCEYNYANFDAIDDICRATKFDTSKLVIEPIEGSGFRFGNKPTKMFFVPCYFSQNGYYSSDIDVYVNGVHQCNLECKEDFC